VEPRDLYLKLGAAVAYVSVRNANGDEELGSAFHVGGGIFITARHVIDGHTVLGVGTTEPSLKATADGKWRDVDFGPHFAAVDRTERAEDPTVDLALLWAPAFAYAPFVPLGLHLDIILEPRRVLLERVLVMGYPRVPLTKPRGRRHATLVASSGEVNALADTLHGTHPVFIVSPMARGGFSGAPALLASGDCLGVVTESLIEQHQSYETGFLAVLTVEPMFHLLKRHGIPKEQASVEELLDLVDAAREVAEDRRRSRGGGNDDANG
jgi:hypothetical protein